MKIMTSSPIISCQIDGETMKTVTSFIFLGFQITADGDCAMTLAPWKKSYDKPRQHIKKQRYYFTDKGPSSQSYSFSSSHVWESWTIKKAEHWRIDAFELWCWKTLESPLVRKAIHPVHPTGKQSWIFIGRTDDKVETPILWPSNAKNWLIWQDPDAGKDWRQEKGTTEDEMVG